ncbi:MAG: hypothetical protein WCS17_11795 [Prevotella sp.]
MKKLMLLVLFCVFLLTSCNENGSDVIYDLNPIKLRIKVLDKNGQNMLDSKSLAYDQTFIHHTSITIQSKTYCLGDLEEEDLKPSTRAYYEPFHGMMIKHYKDITYAVIGPFMADYNWRQEKVVINWGDGSKDDLQFSSIVHYKKNGEPSFHRQYLFNGVDSTDIFEEKGYITLYK